ncbi:hypothetical protein CFBP6411_04815 [Pseudomonas syringae group genomosp. 3]|uniref:Uncharacterized protein n=1 Tax=Pseudomonas syringae group genomosp. 3 TaxID=251701 RepID=A0A2K4WJU8_9PSED|nr:hypothetical protein CFBP6411_04815 [Pseudomonas syringae group genomosp. 3]
MNIRELMERLSEFDPEAKVVIEYDTHFLDIRAVQPELILTEGASWADYPSAKVLDHASQRYLVTESERASYLHSPQQEVIALWGTSP